MTVRITRILLLLGIFSLPMIAHAVDWRLTIEGHHRFVFGDRVLHGYVQIPWSVQLDFQVQPDGSIRGVGSARWLDKITTGSRPENWITCGLEQGSYLDSNLRMQETPRVRFARFPLVGQVDGQTLMLKPGYSPPGNYLAVTYACHSQNPTAGNWFVFAQRARNEEGKRQDAQTKEEQHVRNAKISEVKILPPATGLTLPLQEGWFFNEGTQDADYFAQFRLQRRE